MILSKDCTFNSTKPGRLIPWLLLFKELKRSTAQMGQSNCQRWLIVQLENSQELKVKHIERILPGRFSEEELAPASLEIDERVRREIASRRVGRNDRCPCGSGKSIRDVTNSFDVR